MITYFKLYVHTIIHPSLFSNSINDIIRMIKAIAIRIPAAYHLLTAKLR